MENQSNIQPEIKSDMQLDYQKHFKNMKITKQGFGFLGKGVNVVKFLIENGASVLITDLKTEKQLEKSVQELETFVREKYFDNDQSIKREDMLKNFIDGYKRKRIVYKLGRHKEKYFIDCNYIIQASGVSKDDYYIQHARDNHKKVFQETSLFAKIINEFNRDLKGQDVQDKKIKIIGVTGTRGKTTTTFLIKSIIENYLKEYNLKMGADRKVFIGGNVQNVATLESLKNIKPGDIMVLELDSWSLQGFRDIKFSPHISVFTSFMPDHMNYYKGSMMDYFLDKSNIFVFQKSEDIFIAPRVIESIAKYFEEKTAGLRNQNKDRKTIFLDNSDMMSYREKYTTKLLGDHNKINMVLAVKACEELIQEEKVLVDKADTIIQNTLDSFAGVDGRLQFVLEKNGAKYYNDTTATTPEALIAGLESFRDKNIILISGGRDKELDISDLVDKIVDFKKSKILKKLILLSDDTTTGTHKLKEAFEKKNFASYMEVDDLTQAVTSALELATDNDIVLFSPGFASFGMFLNEYDRGDKFLELVKNIDKIKK